MVCIYFHTLRERVCSQYTVAHTLLYCHLLLLLLNASHMEGWHIVEAGHLIERIPLLSRNQDHQIKALQSNFLHMSSVKILVISSSIV